MGPGNVGLRFLKFVTETPYQLTTSLCICKVQLFKNWFVSNPPLGSAGRYIHSGVDSWREITSLSKKQEKIYTKK